VFAPPPARLARAGSDKIRIYTLSSITRGEALAVTRKMLRGFAGSPDPRMHAHRLCSELLRADDWSTSEEASIRELEAWLKERPRHDLLRAGCEAVIDKLK
jgi:hypothetical protein